MPNFIIGERALGAHSFKDVNERLISMSIAVHKNEPLILFVGGIYGNLVARGKNGLKG